MKGVIRSVYVRRPVAAGFKGVCITFNKEGWCFQFGMVHKEFVSDVRVDYCVCVYFLLLLVISCYCWLFLVRLIAIFCAFDSYNINQVLLLLLVLLFWWM